MTPITLTPFRIGPDWISLSMSGPPSILRFEDPTEWIGNRVWINSGKRTAMMGKLFYLLASDGTKLMTVSGEPNKGLGRAPDWMIVQFANETLHTGEFVELYQTLRSMGFLYLGVTQLHIAADGLEDSGGDFNAPLNWENEGIAEYYGKLHWQPRKEGRRKVKGAALGSPSSNKWFRVYDKTRELKTAAARHKSGYIRAAWAASLGFDPVLEQRTVQRFEFRTKGKEIRRYFPEEATRNQRDAEHFIESLYDQNYLSDVFASMATQCYDFRTPAIRARDATKLVHWDFGAVKSGDLRIEPRDPRKYALSDSAMKQTIKGLWRIAYVTNDDMWKSKAEDLAESCGMSRWMQKSMLAWSKELALIVEAARRSGKPGHLDHLRTLRDNYQGNGPEQETDSPEHTE